MDTLDARKTTTVRKETSLNLTRAGLLGLGGKPGLEGWGKKTRARSTPPHMEKGIQETI